MWGIVLVGLLGGPLGTIIRTYVLKISGWPFAYVFSKSLNASTTNCEV